MMQPKRMSARCPVLGLVLLLIYGAGCDLRDPATPDPVLTTAPAVVLDEAVVELGTATTPIAIAASPTEVTTMVAAQPAELPAFPANSYVLLRLSGRVRLVSGPWWPGPPAEIATYSAVQAAQATGRAQTHLFVVGPAQGMFEPYMREAPNGEDQIALVRINNAPAQLWYSRDMGGRLKTVTGGFCSTGIWCQPTEIVDPTAWYDRIDVEAYHVEEAHTVTATQIAEPMRVDAPAIVAPRQTATFTASPWGGLRLREPVRDTATVRWLWYPGDTTAVSDPNVRGEVIQECRTRTCGYAPDKSGRMLAATFVEGAYVETRSQVVRVQQQRLVLTCSHYTLGRGQTTTCSATANPSGTLDSIRWEFVGSAGHSVRDSSGSPSWGGKVVLGGRIAVAAMLNGSPVAADTVLVVQPRAWLPIRVVAADSGNGHLPAAPTTYGQLADTHAPYPMQPFVTERVSNGPNAGMWYIKDPIPTVTANVHISDGFNPGTAFFAQQHAGTDPVTGNPFCPKSQVHTVERGAREHEGLVSSALISHVEVYQRWFRTNAPQDSMESVIGRDDEFSATWTFSDKVTLAYIDRVAQPAYQDPNQKHTTDNPPGLVAFPAVPCALRF